MFGDQKKELATIQEQSIQVLGSLTAALEKGKLAPEQLSLVLDAQERVLDRQAKQEFVHAMMSVQSQMAAITNDSYNEQTRSGYASLEAINKQLVPLYTKEGFSLSFGTEDSPLADHVRTVCDVMHIGGHSREYHNDMPLDMVGIKGNENKTKIHGTGSALKYGRRYLTSMIFNTSTCDRDDDGNAAGAEPVELITGEQANILHSKLTDNEINMELFMGWLRKIFPSITSIDNVPVKYYDRVNNKIDETIKQKNKVAK